MKKEQLVVLFHSQSTIKPVARTEGDTSKGLEEGTAHEGRLDWGNKVVVRASARDKVNRRCSEKCWHNAEVEEQHAGYFSIRPRLSKRNPESFALYYIIYDVI